MVSTTQSPSSVVFALTNGQRAVITPTGISSHYVQALDHMKAFQPNEVSFMRPNDELHDKRSSGTIVLAAKFVVMPKYV